ncbi:MAG: C39 family peptidase [Agathobacter sp.]|nr:C39 family peptidase [Agathobacter sp.]
MNEYPEELIELIQKNADTEEFVLNYPLKKGTFSRDVLTEYLDTEKVPLFMQWDERWGYYEYGSNVLGLTGCGPTCLSMVALYLLQDPQMTPLYVAEYSVNNGYCVPGSGTSWNLMSEGARGLGLTVREVSLDEEQIRKNLEAGRPIIAIMGAGDFTDQGHFIVFSGWQDGKIVVNDPNSRTNSAKLWSYEDIKSQIRGMWAYKK